MKITRIYKLVTTIENFLIFFKSQDVTIYEYSLIWANLTPDYLKTINEDLISLGTKMLVRVLIIQLAYKLLAIKYQPEKNHT